jgi:uncharacterized membrane protein
MTLLIDALMVITVLSTGLFTGLLMTVVFFFQKALRELSGPQFALVMQRFLAITRTHPLNYAMTLISGFVRVATLILLLRLPGSGAFLFTLVGLLAFWGGIILTSRYVAEPLYDVFVGWDADAPPDDWRRARRTVLPPEQRHPRAVFGCSLHLLCGGARFADTLSEVDSK